MSEDANVNFNDNSRKKMSSDKNINNIDANAAETETTLTSPSSTHDSGTGVSDDRKVEVQVGEASSSVNDLNKKSDAVDEKLDEHSASDSKSHSQSDACASENTGTEKDEKQELPAPQVVPAAAVAAETENKENVQEKLRMNIGVDENSNTQQPASENCSSHSSSGKSSGEENVEDQANDKGESVQEDTGTSETASKHNPEGRDSPTKIDEHSDNTDGTCEKEKGKSDSENEENCDETASAKELKKKNSRPKGEDKKINIESGVTSIPKSESDKKEEESTEKMEASGVAEDYTEKTVKNEDFNLKLSSFLPPRIARIRRQYSEYDTKLYRDGYPGKPDDPNLTWNMDFYKGKIKCEPNGDFIDNIHELWWDNYDLLEMHHGYIQWLFPIRESGMNYQAQELQLHEVEAIWTDEKAMERLKKSYEMMLNFYGICLLNDKTGELERAQNWKERFRHLNFSMHNYLRITRILKCLGEMGLEEFKAPFLRFMLYEGIITGYLDRTLDSCYNYWIGTVKDDKERESIYDYASQLALQAESEKSDDFRDLCCSL